MNSSFKLLSAALALLVSGAACVPKPIDLDIEPMEVKLVLNASMLPNGALTVWVSRTYSALEPITGTDSTEWYSDLLVEHALVKVTYNGATYPLYHTGNGVYQSAILEQIPGVTYHLSVYDSISKKSATASAVMMAKVPIRSLETIADYTSADTSIKVKVAIADNPHEANYYMMSARQVSDLQKLTGSVTVNQFGPDVQTVSAVVSDKDISPKGYAVTLDLDNFNIGDTVLVSLSNIDKQYYDFLKLREKADNWWSELTREAITYPTNVQNGYGFFVANDPSAKAIIGLGQGSQSVVIDLR